MGVVTTAGLAADVTGSGPAVLVLHGQPGSAADWSAVAALLAASFRVVAPDRPGYGRSRQRAGGFAANAEAAVSLMDRLGIDDFVVAGHSWAGGVALALRHRLPTRVSGTVLVGSVRPGERLGALDRLLASRGVGTAASLTAGRAMAHPLVRRAVEHSLSGSARAAMAEMDRSGSSARMWESFAAEQRALRNELQTLRPALRGGSGPVVVLTGSADRVVAPAVAERLAGDLGSAAQLVVVDGAGHLLPRDRPETVAAAIRQVAELSGFIGPP